MRTARGPVLLIVAMFLGGCSAEDSGDPGVTGGTSTGGSSGGSAGLGGTTGGGTGGVSAGAGTGGVSGGSSYPLACSDVYDPDVVPVFELEIAADQLELLESDCEEEIKEYRPALFRYGSETVEAMVRLKGNWSWRCEKKQFVISFNEVDPNGRFHGLRKIVLDAPWYDPTFLAERLGFSFMRRHGVPWSCVNNARLMLNGEYYGLYANVERVDKEYLQRHFPGAEADGNLYDGGVELRTNEDVADVSRRDALMEASTLAEIDALADLEQAVKVWAGSAVLPDPDSYWAGVEINYFLYDHPARGFSWFPYDMDLMMRQGVLDADTSSVEIGLERDFIEADPFTYQNPDWGREPLFELVLSDQHWCERFLEELRNARDVYDTELMASDLDTWAAQIAAAVAEDPNKPFSNQQHAAAVDNLKAFMQERVAFVDEWLTSATCPVTNWPDD